MISFLVSCQHSHGNHVLSHSSLVIVNYIQLSDACCTESSTLTPASYTKGMLHISDIPYIPGYIFTYTCRFALTCCNTLQVHACIKLLLQMCKEAGHSSAHQHRPMHVLSMHKQAMMQMCRWMYVFSTQMHRPMLIFSVHTKVIGSVWRETHWLRALLK